MQIAQTLSGYSLGGADLLRRAMGKKIQSEMDAQRENFVDGASSKGVNAALSGRIFDQVAKFAGYGFNKSHAAAYALIAYQTAFLKANYPVEFLAASMSEDMGNTDKLSLFRIELDRMDIALLPPDINRSGVDFLVEARDGDRSGVRYALSALKNVGSAAMAAVVAEREAKGPFQSIFDFADRLGTQVFNKRQIENLVRAGAFDTLNPNRRQLYDAVEMLVRHASAAQNDRESKQVNLFGAVDAAPPPLPPVEDWPAQERLQQEFEAIGFYLSSHPLQSYAKTCEKLGVVEWSAVSSGRMSEGRIKLAGIVAARRFTTSSRGAKMAFVQMSDASGSYEITVFSEVLALCRELLESGVPLLATVDVQRWDEGFRLTAQKIQPLEEAAARAAKGLCVFVRDETPLPSLATVFRDHGEKGSGRVRLMLEGREREIEIDLPGGYAISVAMRSAVKAIPGVIDVRDL
jgi:DNA polymerase-3 subunit alpha